MLHPSCLQKSLIETGNHSHIQCRVPHLYPRRMSLVCGIKPECPHMHGQNMQILQRKWGFETQNLLAVRQHC